MNPRTRLPLAAAVIAQCASCATRAPNAIPAPTQVRTAAVAVEQTPAQAAKPTAEKDQLGLDILVAPEGTTFRDRRHLKLGKGRLRVSLGGVPNDLEPSSVDLRALGQGADLTLVESRVYGGPITPELLLGPYIGQEVTAYLWEATSPGEKRVPAILVGFSNGLPVVSIDKQVRVLEAGRVAVPKLPESLREEPTLELVVQASGDQAENDVELSYRSHRVDADMEYQLVRVPSATTARLTGLVSVTNETTIPLVNATLTLSADTNEPLEFGDTTAPKAKTDTDPGATGPSTIKMRFPSPITVAASQKSLFRLFQSTEVGLERKVVVEGPGLPSYNTIPEEVGSASIRAVLDAAAVNGEPVSKAGLVGGQAFLFERADGEPPRGYGAATARPLPGAKGVRIDLGNETKYPSRRRLIARKDLGRCVVETTWEVTVSNPTEFPLPVEDVEPVTGKYTVLDSSVPVAAAEPDHFVFAMRVPGNGEAKVKFRVRTTSCLVKRRTYWPQWTKKGSFSSPKQQDYK